MLEVAVVDSLFVVVLGAGPPSEREWRGFLRMVQQQGPEKMKHLVYTGGGEPTGEQRRELGRMIGPGARVAVVTANRSLSIAARVARLLGWEVRPFPASLGGMDAALEWLEVPVMRAGVVRSSLCALAELMGLPVPTGRA
jgi:hypothetical protein